MERRFLIFLCIPAFFPHTLKADEFETLVSNAYRNNPVLQARRNSAAAYRKETAGKYFLQDPIISYSWMNLPAGTTSFDEHPMSARQIGVVQSVPFPVKLVLSGREQTFAANAEDARVDQLAREVRRKIHILYSEGVYTSRVLELERKKADQLATLGRLTESVYSLHKGSAVDPAETRLAVGKSALRTSDLDTRLNTIRYELAVLTGDSYLSHRVGFTNYPEFNAANGKKDVPADHPQHVIREQELALSRVRRKKAIYNYVPDLSFGAYYRIRDDSLADGGKDQYTLTAGLTVPFYSLFHNPSSVSAAQKRTLASEMMLKDTEIRLRADLERYKADLNRAETNRRIYETVIIPESSRVTDLLLSDYQLHKTGLAKVIDSVIRYYDQRQMLEKVRLEHSRAAAEIEYLTGVQSHEE